MHPANNNREISRTEFNYSIDSNTGKKMHKVHWYVHRDKHIRKEMEQLKNNPELIKSINICFKNLENFGPERREFSNFTWDKKNDMYHCHVGDKGYTFVAMWEVDPNSQLINIVRIGPHENFDFKRHHNKNHSMEKAEAARESDEKFRDNQLYIKKNF